MLYRVMYRYRNMDMNDLVEISDTGNDHANKRDAIAEWSKDWDIVPHIIGVWWVNTE